jgi:integrase
MRLDKIGRKDLKLMFDKIAIKGVRFSSCQTIKIPVNGVIDHAVESEMIEVNHLKNMRFSKNKVKHKVNPMAEDETILLINEMLNYRSGDFYPALLCLLRTGMRIGELQALTWGDIDFEDRLIDINKTYYLGKITSTKNSRNRKVDMSKQLSEVLRKVKHNQWKRYAGKNVPKWVFAGSTGNLLCMSVFRKALNQCLKSAGLSHIRIHDLRHTYATIRLLKGHNIGDVSYQLGHSSINITFDIYGHWLPGKFKSEVDELDTHPNVPYTQPEEKEVSIN